MTSNSRANAQKPTNVLVCSSSDETLRKVSTVLRQVNMLDMTNVRPEGDLYAEGGIPEIVDVILHSAADAIDYVANKKLVETRRVSV